MFFSHFLVRNHLSIISILSDLLAISVGSGELLLLPEVGFALRGSEAGASRGPFPAAPVPPHHHRGLRRKGALGKHGESHGKRMDLDG